MKKIVIFICSMFLILCMCFSFIGCDKPQTPNTNPSASAENTGNPSSQPTQTPDEKNDFDTEPTVNPTTVPKPTTNSNPTVKPTSAPAAGTINVPALTDKMTSIAAIQQSSTSIGNAVLKTYSGNITKLNQKDSYSFTAPRDGIYRIEMSGMKADLDVQMYVFDNFNEQFAFSYGFDNGDGITVSLAANKTYQIQIREYDETVGAYTLNIWSQKATTDITNYTIVKDSIEFVDQRNKYVFTPSISGTYRIEVTGMKASLDTEIHVFDDLDEQIAFSYAFNNGDGTTVSLTANQTYQIQIREYDETVGAYTLNIWNQKITTDITNCTIVKDSIEFVDQRNKYVFTPSISGTYRFELTGMKADLDVELFIFNDLDEQIKFSYAFSNGDGITVSLVAHATYQIQVREYDETLGSYTLNIWFQKPTVDVNGKVQIKDSIQYTDQQNVYNFTVKVAGKHIIKITGLESSVTTKIYVYNDLDEKVEYDTSYKNNDSISLSNLKVGDSYRIVVYQSSGTGSYTLTIS